MNAPFNLRQIGQYPQVVPSPGDLMLLQQGVGGPYVSAQIADFIKVALSSPNPVTVAGEILASDLGLAPTGVIGWGTDPTSNLLYGSALRGALAFTPGDGWRFDYANPEAAVTLAKLTAAGQFELIFGTVSVARDPSAASEVATRHYVDCCSVSSFNGRTGSVCLDAADVYGALHLFGTVATQEWVTSTICTSLQSFYANSPFVYSFNGRTGYVTMTADDITQAATAPGAQPQASNPALGDASGRIATTLFVDESMDDLEQRILAEVASDINLSAYAPLASPSFSGIPTAPTANPGTSTGQLATTAFVQAAVTASTTGVSSFNTRTGAVVLTTTDVTNAGAAPIASPTFTGTPAAPTATTGTSSTQLATTAFVHAVVSALGTGVTSFNTRTGAVTLVTADITGAGGAPIAGPSFTGTVTAPTPAPATNNTTVATTAYVTAAITALGTPVTTFNGRTGAVTLQNNDISAAGGALVASPTFTGIPAAPTAVNGTNTTQLATCQFVLNEIGALSAGVTSFNTRTGAVTLVTADITGAGGAPVASPSLTGVPTAPTAAPTSSDTTIATTAFVHAAITAQSLVSSFNSRTGAVTLSAADVSGAGGALIASPTFTGTPAGPTAVPGTSTTQLATTQFVMTQLSTGAVTSFNGRNGAITLTGADITSAGGALLASPTFTGTPNAPTATAGTNNTQIATTAFVQAVIAAGPYVPIAGGTMTGFLTMPSMSGGGTVANTINGAAGTDRILFGKTAGSARWGLDLGTATAEGGSNAGSDFAVYRYSDTGTALSPTPLTINRSTGAATFGSTVYSGGFLYSTYNTVTDFYMGASGTLRSINFQGSGVYAIQLDTSTGIFNFIGNSTSAATMKYDGTFQVFNTNATKPGGGSWVAPSDIRIKNIVGGYDRGLDDILRLNPVVYEYKGNNPSTKLISSERKRFVGLIAQDVENVFPDMVMKVDSEIDGKPVSDMRQMDITELMFAMINAFRSLAERVSVLEARQ